MLLHFDGFDHYGDDETKLIEGTYSQADGSFSISTTNPRTGSSCLRRDNSSNDHYVIKDLDSQKSSVGCGASFYMSNMPTQNRSYEVLYLGDSSNNKQIGIFIDPDGSVSARVGDNGSVISRSEASIVTSGTYNNIEIAAIADNEDLVFSGYCGDISSMSYSGKSLSSGLLNNPFDCTLSPDGLTLLVVNEFSSPAIFQFTLSTAYDLSTASYSGNSIDVSSQMIAAHSIYMSQDGLKMYISESSNPFGDPAKTHQYTLSSPYNLSGAVYDNKFFEPVEDDGMWAVAISEDGGTMIGVGDFTTKLYQYSLSNPGDISTASYTGYSFDISGFANGVHNIIAGNSGAVIYILGVTDNNIYQITLTSAWDLRTAEYANLFYSTSAQTTITHGFCFDAAATNAYVADVTSKTIYQYNMNCSETTASGYVEVRINGVSVIVNSSSKTTYTDEKSYSNVALSFGSNGMHGVTTDIDDYYIWDNLGSWNNSFIGDRRCILKHPNKDTIVADFTPSIGDFGYKMIDDTSPDEDDTYIIAEAYLQSGSPLTGTSEFGIEDLDNDVSLISGINVITRASKTDATSADIYTSINSNGYSSISNPYNLSITYRYYTDIYEYDPSIISSFNKSTFNEITVSITADDLQEPILVESPTPATDPYFSFVVSLLLFDGIDGSTTFIDEIGKTWTGSGNAQIDTDFPPSFATGCLLLDGSGDLISTPTSTDFDLGSTYTIEFYINPATLAANFGVVHRGFYTTATNLWDGLAFSIRHLSGAPGFYRCYFYGISNATEQYIDFNDTVTPAGSYTHFAMVRNGSNGEVFVGGTSVGTISSLNTPAASSRSVKVGVWDFSSGAEYLNGQLYGIRITKGVARYTTNFTPPNEPFPTS